jgi:signal transduction histidine kinase/response regulator of citrate/malate metabolism
MNTSLLLIEDDIIDQKVFEREVRNQHLPYEVMIARSIAEAQALIQQHFFDVIVADYWLGDGTALDLLSPENAIPMIIVTGAGGEEIAVTAMKSGAYDYLIKDNQRNYLKILPHTVANTIKRKRIELAEVEQRTLAEALRDTGQILNSTLEIDEVLKRILETVRRVVPHDRANLMLLDGDTVTIAQSTGWPDGQKATIQSQHFKLHEFRALWRMYETQQPFIVSDVQAWHDWINLPELDKIYSYVGVPVCIQKTVVGFINLDSLTSHFFTPTHAERLHAFANQAALALHNARLYDQAQALAAIEERQRIARDLHDSVTQTLFSASMIADSIVRLWERNPNAIYPELIDLRDLTRQALMEMRGLLLELRPNSLTDIDMADLLQQLTQTVAQQTRLQIMLDIKGSCVLPAKVQIALFRIAQESLNNIVKHAQAKTVVVELVRGDAGAILEICDDGRGFDIDQVSAAHLGLRIMRERAESAHVSLKIESRLYQGTEITAQWLVEGK